MKSIHYVAFAGLLLFSCGKQAENQTFDGLTFTVPDNLSANQLTAAIDTLFMTAYRANKLDTAHYIVRHELYKANMLHMDSGALSCREAYIMYIRTSAIAESRYDNFTPIRDYFYYIEGTGRDYKVWDRPITSQGDSEDGTRSASVTFDYSINDECRLFSLLTKTALLTVGIKETDSVRFYAWSPGEHTFVRLANVPLTYKGAFETTPTINWKIDFIKNGKKPYDFDLIAKGDSTNIERYTWKDNHYEKTGSREDPSRYVLNLQSMEMEGAYRTSVYPWFTSEKNPQAAMSVNKALQLMETNSLLTPANKKAWMSFCAQDDRKTCWNFWIHRMNDNILELTTHEFSWGTASDRSEPNHTLHNYYFNATTGDVIYLEDLIAPGMVDSVGRLGERELAKAPQGDCPVDGGLWSAGGMTIYMDPAALQLIFEAGGECEFGDERVNVSVPVNSIPDGFTDYFYDLMEDSPPVLRDSISHLWNGSIGKDIAITLLLHQQTGGKIVGKEAYDKHGSVIPFEATFQLGNFHLEEKDGSGKTIGTIDARFIDRTLTGKWTDGKKTLPFEAFIAGESPDLK